MRQQNAPSYVYEVALVDGDVTMNTGHPLAVDVDVIKNTGP